ncbi:MAG TPA: aminopeptidase P family N-terminal domain-containing protein, partial [Ktedonobacteraceae bacterium]|nr:aminopeptidase P family N-terminal domain-containing protein [Ktedonobacteraceae bacterium]
MTVHVRTLGAGKQRIVEAVRAGGLDGMLLCSPEHVYYTTGLPAVQGSGNPILFALRNQLPYFVYVGADGTMTLLCWIGATMGFSFDVDEVRSFFSTSSALDELRDFLKATLRPGGKVGIESSCPWNVVTLMQKVAPSTELSEIDELMLGLRMVKTTEELECIRRATTIVEATVTDLRASVRPGISRVWLIGEAKRLMLAHGASGIGHTTIAFGSSNA